MTDQDHDFRRGHFEPINRPLDAWYIDKDSGELHHYPVIGVRHIHWNTPPEVELEPAVLLPDGSIGSVEPDTWGAVDVDPNCSLQFVAIHPEGKSSAEIRKAAGIQRPPVVVT